MPVVTGELGWVKFGSGPPGLLLNHQGERRFSLAGTQTEAKIRSCVCESTPAVAGLINTARLGSASTQLTALVVLGLSRGKITMLEFLNLFLTF